VSRCTMLTLENQDFEFWMQRPGSYLLPVRFRVKGLGLEHGNQPLAGPINIMARLVQTLERHSHLKCRVEVQGARFGICQREITTRRAKENRVSKIIEFWCKENRVSKRIEFWCLGSRGYIPGRDHDLSDDGEGDRQGDSEALSLED